MNNNTGHPTERSTGNRRTLTRVSPRLSPLLKVLVIASDGRLLNPCHPARARELIRKQRATRVCHHPYTIRLLDLHRHKASIDPPEQEST